MHLDDTRYKEITSFSIYSLFHLFIDNYWSGIVIVVSVDCDYK